jgi:predicted nucleotidyltransferase
MDLHPDFRDLLAEFVREKVEFVLIGGYAVGRYTKPRATKDLDLLVAGSDANLERVARALERFGAPRDVVKHARSLAADEVLYLGRDPVRIDVLRRADGIDTEAAIARAVHSTVDGLSIPVISLDDLIANKRASGRAQDLVDAALLEKARTSQS